MFPIKPQYQPTRIESLIIFIIILGLMSYFIIGLGTVPHIPMLIGVLLLIGYGLINRISFNHLQTGMIEGAKTGMSAIFLFFLIGILISSWMICGTIAILFNSVFMLFGGICFSFFLFAVTAIIGVYMRSSLITRTIFVYEFI